MFFFTGEAFSFLPFDEQFLISEYSPLGEVLSFFLQYLFSTAIDPPHRQSACPFFLIGEALSIPNCSLSDDSNPSSLGCWFSLGGPSTRTRLPFFVVWRLQSSSLSNYPHKSIAVNTVFPDLINSSANYHLRWRWSDQRFPFFLSDRYRSLPCI